MTEPSPTESLLAEVAQIADEFRKAQLPDSAYDGDDALAQLDAAGYLAVDLCRRLSTALTKAEERARAAEEQNAELRTAVEQITQRDKARTDALEEAAARYEVEAERVREAAEKYQGYYQGVRSAYQQAAVTARALAVPGPEGK